MNFAVRSVLMFALIVGTGAVASAKGKNAVPGSDCYVKQLNTMMSWNKFFSWVATQSRGGQCSYGRIASSPRTGRVYIDGRKVGADASVNESKSIIRNFGYTGQCETYTCEETGLVVIDPANPQVPANPDAGAAVVIPVTPTIVVPAQGW